MAQVNYFLTEEQQMIVDLARQIAVEKIIPVRAKLDENEEFPWDIMKDMAQADLFGLYIPEEYGGFAKGCFENCLALEQLAYGCIAVTTTFAASALGGYPILLFGSDEQKACYLPDIAAGKRLVAFGLTEANAGSDAAGIQTTATEDGDHWVLNGTKQWITSGGEAEIYTIVAMTNKNKGARGATAYIVEKGDPGFSFGKKERKMGLNASSTRELVFNECRIPKDRMLGKKGQGFIMAMRTLDLARPGIGAIAVGLAQAALDEAVKYARQRIQFGQPIISFQALQHMLADMATKIEASRALVYSVARTIDDGTKDTAKISAMAKLFATDMAMQVTTDAVQILGGYGYMKSYPVEKMMRDAKILQIYEGTNQILRNVIGQSLNKEYAKK
ncbi:MAG: acyl-CoA dehydrogenase family protein [Deltaproteobacteria bacterium]|nr:acyl-CoA dehydrogenase family protein [Deltaproteobacteria bacterium]MBW1718588.1 acyl-CoA dehydrogenase family protein [Deltaproteobacteria bacterium]MBW1931736.1 acyl-CoA dehydrogenase family protein [Deltaproteobacteria bacterium]MBW1937940.1 acyl-CoA dehydrogenase family protein [Deltaproteobacteria bacterium]MBW1964672.1 acyl-CoA dehydrogenase family protein [Deltaproteobacteria bacterium]